MIKSIHWRTSGRKKKKKTKDIQKEIKKNNKLTSHRISKYKKKEKPNKNKQSVLPSIPIRVAGQVSVLLRDHRSASLSLCIDNLLLLLLLLLHRYFINRLDGVQEGLGRVFE
jgi:hypothetical protein